MNLNDDVTHAGATPLVARREHRDERRGEVLRGRRLAGRGIDWDATLAPAPYRPPGWDRYTFTPLGKRSTRQYWRDYGASSPPSSQRDDDAVGRFPSRRSRSASPRCPRERPSLLSVDATVTDFDRQTIRASSRTILVHPSDALRRHAPASPRRDDALAGVVTDIDGNPVAGVPIDVTIEGVLGSERYRDDAEVVDTQHCKLTSATTPVDLPVQAQGLTSPRTRRPPRSRIARGRRNAASSTIPWWAPARSRLRGRPRQAALQARATSRSSTIRSKVVPATAVVTFARQGVIAQKRVELTSRATTVELPIETAYIQNVHVVVDRSRSAATRTGGSTLPLPEHSSHEVEPRWSTSRARASRCARARHSRSSSPVTNATFEVEVKRDDKPVAGAEVALIVVDEAVLALSGSRTPIRSRRSIARSTTAPGPRDARPDRGRGRRARRQAGFERYKLDDGERRRHRHRLWLRQRVAAACRRPARLRRRHRRRGREGAQRLPRRPPCSRRRS